MRNRWSVRVSIQDVNGQSVILLKNDYPTVHLAAEDLGMTYNQLNAIVKKGGVYGTLRSKNRFTPQFEVVKYGQLIKLEKDIKNCDM